MGSVDRAYDTVLRRDVAIKRLLPGEGSETRHLRLLREARAVAQLNHPNVVAVHDVGETSAVRFIVMELVEGGSLADRMKPPLVQALDWLEQVADALDAAHRV